MNSMTKKEALEALNIAKIFHKVIKQEILKVDPAPELKTMVAAYKILFLEAEIAYEDLIKKEAGQN